MGFSISRLGVLLYVVPALSSFFVVPLLGYDYSTAGGSAIFFSAVASVLGYSSSKLFASRNISDENAHPCKSYLIYSYVFLLVGIFCALVNFLRIGSLPLFSGNQARVDLQNSILWNLYIFCSVGIFIFSFAEMRRKANKVGWYLLFFYLFLAILSAWKGVLLNFIFLFFLPRYKNAKISLLKLFYIVVCFLAMFIFINGLRGGGFISTLTQPVFYAYWGFVNFDNSAVAAVSSCLHSVPLFGCKFAVDDGDLMISTWNVYTALTPLYVDGGVYLVVAVFFVFGFLSGFFENRKNRLLFDYLHYMSFYFFFLAHNGYILYSSVYFSALFLIVLVEFMAKNYRKRVPVVAGG